MVKELLKMGHIVTTLDNFSTGHPDAIVGGDIVQGDLSDKELVDRTFENGQFTAVFHFASSIEVGESILDPAKYYRNNFCNTLNLLDVMVKHEVKHLIFSSTAAVYGEPHYLPIDETHTLSPINPYGKSKLMVEQALDDYEAAYGLHSVVLRYFNACGADPEGELGERHEPETHLIPLILKSLTRPDRTFTIFGNDYETPDGTCIRDYVHVSDLCEAHILALRYLQTGGASDKFNLGNNYGYSVNEVIATVERVTGRKVTVIHGLRRPGDPARLIADASKAKRILGWNPRYSDIDTIITHAWAWECAQLVN